MKNEIFSGQSGRQRSETIVFAVLGLAAFVTVGAALFAGSNFVREKDRIIAAASGNASRQNYFTSGRWQADCRTFIAMVRYVLEPEYGPLPSAHAGAPGPNFPVPLHLAATNSMPKA